MERFICHAKAFPLHLVSNDEPLKGLKQGSYMSCLHLTEVTVVAAWRTELKCKDWLWGDRLGSRSQPRKEMVEPELWCVVRVGHSGRCVNYLGCKMSGHLDLLCVREWGNGCGYKISSRPLARITTWKMLKWTVRSCYGRGKFWTMESSINAEHDVARRGYVCVNCRWPLLLHRSPNPHSFLLMLNLP